MSNKWLQNIEKVIVSISSAMSNCATFSLMILMLIIVADVFLRCFFNHPILGSVEIVELMLLVTVFLVLPNNQYKKINIVIDVFYSRMSQKARRIMDIIIDVASLIIVSLLSWRAFTHFQFFIDSKSSTDLLKMPVAPFQFILAFGWLMLGIVLLHDLFSTILKETTR
jgi:TRAP-type transport system small permease protein